MITVVLDRDSVAMGDDVESHLVSCEFEDDATIGDVLLHVIEERYLPIVNGTAWVLCGAKYQTFAVMHIDSTRPADHYVSAVTSLWDRGLRYPITSVSGLEINGVYPFRLRYHSDGRALSFAEFKTRIRPDAPS